MVDIVKLAAVAERLINENGRDITLLIAAETPLRDANKPWLGVANPVDNGNQGSVIVKAVFIEVGTETQFGEDLEDDANLLTHTGENHFLVSINSLGLLDIRDFTQILDGTETFNIASFTILKPGDTGVIASITVEG